MENDLFITAEENWLCKNKILVILAHPDDPEFFCGASIARWCSMGHEVEYVLLTRGDKGGDKNSNPQSLVKTREQEQKAAASKLGVKKVTFLNFPDGYLFPNIEARKAVVAQIRRAAPDVVVGCDPQNLFHRPGAINHPDHRAAGQIVIDAVFPAAGNYHYFPELLEDGLLPVSVKELWLSIPASPNLVLDISAYWQQKIEALHEHKSQIGDVEQFDEKMRKRLAPDSTLENPRYEEKFYRVIFS